MGDSREIQPTTTVRRGKDLSFRQLDDEIVAIDEQAGYCYSLNESAGRIWELIATPLSLESICAKLRAEYKVDEQTCMRETIAVLQGLRDAGLVDTSDATAR